ncbi:class I SAM-dependent methyltransferase [Rhodococcus sp. NPDC058521]|uniref:class I SAM-dependent methyltransferase n=1 Tax=Rhodococcus sp. NPDC058521 TaxID=3346536 RepID=UPI0036560BE4
MGQPGYDALAELYAETFPSPYLRPIERHAIHAFADMVNDMDGDGLVIDVGCGPGDVTADLAQLGLDVLGVDPSPEMLAIARRKYPNQRFALDDAHLSALATTLRVDAILARFSLIHVPPNEIPGILSTWHERLRPEGVVAVACQMADETVPDVAEFDHRVARAWRWNPDHLTELLTEAGFTELWRTIGRPDADHRFPEVHLVFQRESEDDFTDPKGTP